MSGQASTSTTEYSWYYELHKLNETITEAFYPTQPMRLSRALKKKRAHYHSTQGLIFLKRDNSHAHFTVSFKTRISHYVMVPKIGKIGGKKHNGTVRSQ